MAALSTGLTSSTFTCWLIIVWMFCACVAAEPPDETGPSSVRPSVLAKPASYCT